MRGIYFLFLAILLIGIVSAQSSFFIAENEDYDIKFSCELDGKICDASVGCNISINYPNSTVMVDNQIATNLNNGYFNYSLNGSLNDTTPKGEYSALVHCTNITLKDTATFNYEVNLAGIRPSESRTQSITRSIYFIFIIGLILFAAFLFTKPPFPVKWTFFLIAIMFFLTAINIIFVGLQDEVVNPSLENLFSGITTMSFIFFWGAFTLLMVMWILTIFHSVIMRKKISDKNKFGDVF